MSRRAAGGRGQPPSVPQIHLGKRATSDQLNATKRFRSWLKNRPNVDSFALAGYAGTGKTHLLSVWVSTLRGAGMDVAVACLTNRAAAVLRDMGVQGASTIHAFLYQPDERADALSKAKAKLRDTQRRYDAAEPDSAGELMPQIERRMKKVSELMVPTFSRKDGGRLPDLLVIDEASMVPVKMVKDIKELDVPVVFSGDPGQLKPPDNGPAAFHSMRKDATLREIVRQDDDDLLSFATHARNERAWGKVTGAVKPHGEIPLQPVLDSFQRDNPFADGSAVALCHSNAIRQLTNRQVRDGLKRTGILPEPGDVLMSAVTSKGTFEDGSPRPSRLHNGSQYLVVEANPIGNDVLHVTLRDLDGEFDCYIGARWFEWFAEGVYDAKGTAFAKLETGVANRIVGASDGMLLEGGVPVDSGTWRVPVQPCEWGYALTAHRAQGGEWDTVVLFDDHRDRSQATEDYGQWLYTAATRAKKELHIGKARWPTKPTSLDHRRLQALRRRWNSESTVDVWAWPIVHKHVKERIRGGDAKKVAWAARRSLETMTGIDAQAIEEAVDDSKPTMAGIKPEAKTLVHLACGEIYEAYLDGRSPDLAKAAYAAADAIQSGGSDAVQALKLLRGHPKLSGSDLTPVLRMIEARTKLVNCQADAIS